MLIIVEWDVIYYYLFVVILVGHHLEANFDMSKEILAMGGFLKIGL